MNRSGERNHLTSNNIVASDAISSVHGEKVKHLVQIANASPLLDAGCGKGDISVVLAKRGYRVVGIDISGRRARLATQRARRDALEYEVCVGSLTNLPFKANSFDTECCIDVLEHIPDFTLSLRELQRVLRIGGRLIIAVPALAHGLIYDDFLLKTPISSFVLRKLGFLDHVERGHFHVHRLAPFSLRSTMESLHLKVDSFYSVVFLSTYLDTIRNLTKALFDRSISWLHIVTDLDSRVAKHLPPAFGSSWLIVATKTSNVEDVGSASGGRLQIGSQSHTR